LERALRLTPFDTISLRDDRLAANQAVRRAGHSLAGPLPHLRVGSAVVSAAWTWSARRAT